jgi:hypothetical protein
METYAEEANASRAVNGPTRRCSMARAALVGTVVLSAVLPILLATPAPAEDQAFMKQVYSCQMTLDGEVCKEARVFSNAEKTVFVACPAGGFVYRIDRKAKKVFALRRPLALNMGDRCRLVEGAPEQPVDGARFRDEKSGFAFNDLAGRKVAVRMPEGAMR